MEVHSCNYWWKLIQIWANLWQLVKIFKFQEEKAWQTQDTHFGVSVKIKSLKQQENMGVEKNKYVSLLLKLISLVYNRT